MYCCCSLALPFTPSRSMIGYNSLACVTLRSFSLNDRAQFHRLRYPSLLLTPPSGTIHSLALPFAPSHSTIGHDPTACVTLPSFSLHDRARSKHLRYPSLLLSRLSGTIHTLALPFAPSRSTIGHDSHPYFSHLLTRRSGMIRCFFAFLKSVHSKTIKRPARMLSVLQSFILSNPF